MWLHKIFRTRVEAGQLADLLFEKLVLEDEAPWHDRHLLRYGKSVRNTVVLEQLVFTYLVASIVVTLTNENTQHSNAAIVITKLRDRVTKEASKRWGRSGEDIDRNIEEAGRNLARLLFTDPEQNPGLSVDWARGWLGYAGVEESNPASLFLISSIWKNRHIHLAKMIHDFRIMS